MKDQVFGVLQRIGRSFMLPIALLPAAGLLLGIGGSFSNVTMLEAYGLTRIMGPGTFWNALFMVMSRAGDIVFTNLPILFAMGVAIGMAKKEKEVAALAAVISFLVMHAAIGAMIAVNGGADSLKEGAGAMVAGIRSLQMGVFGGILVGLGTAWLHNRYYKIELPQVLSFFGGTRFVPIVCALFYVLVGILMYFVWPPVQTAISGVGRFVLRSGYPGTWFYGFVERALIPFGLHHVFYIPFWQTAVGGSMEIGGRTEHLFCGTRGPCSSEIFCGGDKVHGGKVPAYDLRTPRRSSRHVSGGAAGKEKGGIGAVPLRRTDFHVHRDHGTAGVYIPLYSASALWDPLCVWCTLCTGRSCLYVDAYL